MLKPHQRLCRASLTNLNSTLTRRTKKNMLYKQFFTWNCKGCSIALLRDYAMNQIYQELPEKSVYFTTADEQVYLHFEDSSGCTSELKNYSGKTVT